MLLHGAQCKIKLCIYIYIYLYSVEIQIAQRMHLNHGNSHTGN